jgi:opacity protein-like surface antigen
VRKFACAAVLAAAISAPVLAGALVDHSAVSVLGAPGGCSSSCSHGAFDTNNPGQAHGGYQKAPPDELTGVGFSQAGTPGTGRITLNGTTTGTQSGNYRKQAGHCTGFFSC